MRQPKLARPARQLGLFHPPTRVPRWATLPLPVRQAVLPLLVELLKAAARPAARDAVATPGGADE